MRLPSSFQTTLHTFTIAHRSRQPSILPSYSATFSSFTVRNSISSSSIHLRSATRSISTRSSTKSSNSSRSNINKLYRYSASSMPTLPFIGSLFSTSKSSSSRDTDMADYPVKKSADEWQAVLSPEQFRVIRQKGTEAPYVGKYDKHMPSEGVYTCAACAAPLYTANHKFKSGCGWPAYFDNIPGAVERHTDRTLGMDRTEITCANCGGHLGHVFKGEGYPTPTDERHCVNSVSLNFSADDKSAGENGKA